MGNGKDTAVWLLRGLAMSTGPDFYCVTSLLPPTIDSRLNANLFIKTFIASWLYEGGIGRAPPGVIKYKLYLFASILQRTRMLTLLEDKMTTPLGPLWVLCDENFHLRAVEWEEHSDRMEQLLDIHYRAEGYTRVACRNPGGLSQQLANYFDGDLSVIESLPTATAGTPFQREVWQALRTIPCGQVMHYGQLAERLGRPGAARAVGAANGANPVSIVVPCHRVIGRNGTMTGYAGGVQRKEWLLRHEGYLLI